MKPVPNAADVAQWMCGELQRQRGVLYQDEAASQIVERFGDDPFTYINEHGNLAIDRGVLAAFRTLTKGSVVWDRSERLWRWREDYDPPGRQVE